MSEHDTHAIDLYHDQLIQSTQYTGQRCKGLLRLALEVAYLAHNGQLRKSGEAYITHPVAVAAILAESRLDIETVVSGLLHDTVEDTELTFEDVHRLFGGDVRRIVEGETKVSKLPKMVRTELEAERLSSGNLARTRNAVVQTTALNKQDEQVENLRSMFVAMAEDWRIVVVKLADRLHNMRTLEFMPPHKRISIARETLEIFAPLAHRLGMWSFRSELADLSLKFLFPSEYTHLKEYIAGQKLAYEATLEAATLELNERLCSDARLIDPRTGESLVTITGRTKNIHSTWKKLQRRECNVGEVLDLVALRIVIDTDGGDDSDDLSTDAEDMAICYHVLGKVHAIWTPLPRTLKDYISSPKPNGYRSLHTTVLVGAQPLEVQIRTRQMHTIAEYGAAAHWAYTEGKEEEAVADGITARDGAGGASSWPRDRSRRAWLQPSSSQFSSSIAKWGQDVECAHEFMQLVRQELLGTRVFVFTESGGSTRILNLARGATLGDAARQLDVNLATHVPLISGSPADLGTQLSNGEIVSFMLRDALEGRLLKPPGSAGEDGPPGGEGEAGPIERARLMAGASGARMWRVCERCLPLPGDALVCTTHSGSAVDFAESDGGDAAAQQQPSPLSLTLHRANCECLALRRQMAAGERLIRPTPALTEQYREKLDAALKPFSPDGDVSRRRDVYTTKVIVFTSDRPGLLLSVSSVVTSETLNILDVHSKTWEVGLGSAFQYKVLISSVEQLESLIASLEALDDVVRVVRGDMEDMLHDLGENAFWQYARPP